MWFWLALASAILGAIDVILNKHSLNKVSAVVLTWSLFTLSIPVLFYLSFKDGIPYINLGFFVGVFGSSVAFIFSKTIINETLKKNLVSKVLPLTAFSGIFTYIFGLILLSESLKIIPILGVISIVFGSYILNVDQAKEDLLKPFKILFSTKSSLLFLIAIMLGSLTVVFDKIGVINTKPFNPALTILLEQAIMSCALTVYLMAKEKNTWVTEVKKNFKILTLNSVIYLFVGLLLFTAYIDGAVALVLAIKRLQIFFILFLSYLFFKDKPTKHSWIATIIMVIGVLMIKLG